MNLLPAVGTIIRLFGLILVWDDREVLHRKELDPCEGNRSVGVGTTLLELLYAMDTAIKPDFVLPIPYSARISWVTWAA